jgi:hypothetical protein
MVRDQKGILGDYLFDGTVLYTSHKYPSDVSLVYLVLLFVTR